MTMLATRVPLVQGSAHGFSGMNGSHPHSINLLIFTITALVSVQLSVTGRAQDGAFSGGSFEVLHKHQERPGLSMQTAGRCMHMWAGPERCARSNSAPAKTLTQAAPADTAYCAA